MSPRLYFRTLLAVTSILALLPAALFAGDGTVQLCGDATDVRAIRYHDVVIVVASGTHPRAGYEAWFDHDGGTPEIPGYKLMHFNPDISATVVTPFATNTAFIDGEHQTHHIAIHDASGTHNIPVQDIGNAEQLKQLLEGSKAGGKKSGDK
jgi:hypothetical protein